jgi:hypothetical protein
MPKVIKNEKKVEKVRLNVNITPALADTIANLADCEGASKAEIVKKAIALFEVVVEAKEKGGKLLIIDEKANTQREIIGI